MFTVAPWAQKPPPFPLATVLEMITTLLSVIEPRNWATPPPTLAPDRLPPLNVRSSSA